MFFYCLAVTVAMYTLITFYLNVKEALASHRPLLKLLCIKLVIFFSFWQMVVLDLLATNDLIKPSRYLSHGDIAIGFNALLICFEMIIFSILHLYAFSVEPYRADPELGPAIYAQPPKSNAWRALRDVINPFDIVKAFLRGLKWSFIGHRRRHDEAKRVAERKDASPAGSTQGLVYPMPGRYPSNASAGGGGGGVYVPGPGTGGLMVHHPTPSDQEPVAVEEIPTHGLAEREHEAPAPPQRMQLPPQRMQSPPQRMQSPPPPPPPPHRQYTGGPRPQGAGRPQPNILPYPDSLRGRSYDGQGLESHELLESMRPSPVDQPWNGPGLRGGQAELEAENPWQRGGVGPGGGGVGGGYTYSESMIDADGVYRGPTPRRTGRNEEVEGGLRGRVV